MDFAAASIYLVYPLVSLLLLWGVKPAPKGQLYQDHFSLDQSKNLQGVAALVIMLHHASQKTCASWINPFVVRHGLDGFLETGYVLVGFFFFCSGYGLYKSVVTKPDYLKIKNFFGKRIWPVVAGFYLTMLIFLGVRYWRGQHISSQKLIAYVTGASLCNKNAWYCIAIVILYIVFWISFSLSKNRNKALPVILCWLGTIAYLCVGLYIDHNDWWFCGEWWYNSVLLFPLGMTFARHENAINAVLQKKYWISIIACTVLFIVQIQVSHDVTGHFGYYGETWHQPLVQKLSSRFLSALAQSGVAVLFALLMYVLTMKFHFGNRITSWLGSVTLEFYLIHGLFIELFGFNFLDVTRPLRYIKNVSLYVIVVTVCSVVATVILQALLHPVRTWNKFFQKTVK